MSGLYSFLLMVAATKTSSGLHKHSRQQTHLYYHFRTAILFLPSARNTPPVFVCLLAPSRHLDLCSSALPGSSLPLPHGPRLLTQFLTHPPSLSLTLCYFTPQHGSLLTLDGLMSVSTQASTECKLHEGRNGKTKIKHTKYSAWFLSHKNCINWFIEHL